MPKVYKVSLYVIDANGDYTGREDYLKSDLKEQIDKLWITANHLELEESKEFEWDDDLVINNVISTVEDFEKYFNK